MGQGTCQGVTYGRDFPTISANYKWLHSVFRPRAPQIRCSWLLSLHPVERNHGGETLVEKHSWGKRFSGEALVEKNFDGEAFRWRSTLVDGETLHWQSYLGGETMLEKKRCLGLNVPHISDQNFFCLDGCLIK